MEFWEIIALLLTGAFIMLVGFAMGQAAAIKK